MTNPQLIARANIRSAPLRQILKIKNPHRGADLTS